MIDFGSFALSVPSLVFVFMCRFVLFVTYDSLPLLVKCLLVGVSSVT